MSALATALLIFASTLAGAQFGPVLRDLLPVEHLSEDAKDVVKLGTGFVASIAALVISLLVSSAKTSFDERMNEVCNAATDLIVLDRILADYGKDTAVARASLSTMTHRWVERIWPERGTKAELDPLRDGRPPIEILESEVRALKPATDAGKGLQSDALAIISDIQHTRWLLFEQLGRRDIPGIFIVVLGVWLSTIFLSFGLFAPRNSTVTTVYLICALSAACAIFLILEMDDPFNGVIKLSSAPFESVIAELGR